MGKTNIIGLKDLRENTEHYIREVGKGKSFAVVRRSQPIFQIAPIDGDDERLWDTVVDLEKVRRGGIPIGEVIEILKRLRGRDQMKKPHGRHPEKARAISRG